MDITVSLENDRFIKEVTLKQEYLEALRFNTVIDCGANIGAFSLYIYNFANAIYAIEPNSTNFAHLLKTVSYNELTKIVPVNCAIGNFNGTATLSDNGDPENSGGGWQLNDQGANPHDVTVMTLARFIKDRNIDFVDLLKIDCEGEEHRIFRTTDFAEVANHIGTIVGEVHSGAEIKSVLSEYGFKYTELPNNHFRAVK